METEVLEETVADRHREGKQEQNAQETHTEGKESKREKEAEGYSSTGGGERWRRSDKCVNVKRKGMSLI